MNLKNELVDEVIASVVRSFPKAVAESLEKISSKEDSDLGRSVLTMFADFARTSDLDNVEYLGTLLKRIIIGGDSRDILELSVKFDALYMSNLTDALQKAEAEEKEQCSKICETIGTVLGNLGKAVLTSALSSVTKGI